MQVLLKRSKQQSLAPCRLLAARRPALAQACLLPTVLDLLENDSAAGKFSSGLASAMHEIFASALKMDPPPSVHHMAIVEVRAF